MIQLPLSLKVGIQSTLVIKSADEICSYVDTQLCTCLKSNIPALSKACFGCSCRITCELMETGQKCGLDMANLSPQDLLLAIALEGGHIRGHEAPKFGKPSTNFQKKVHQVNSNERYNITKVRSSSSSAAASSSRLATTQQSTTTRCTNLNQLAGHSFWFAYPCGFPECEAVMWIGAVVGENQQLVIQRSAVSHTHRASACKAHSKMDCAECADMIRAAVTGGVSLSPSWESLLPPFRVSALTLGSHTLFGRIQLTTAQLALTTSGQNMTKPMVLARSLVAAAISTDRSRQIFGTVGQYAGTNSDTIGQVVSTVKKSRFQILHPHASTNGSSSSQQSWGIGHIVDDVLAIIRSNAKAGLIGSIDVWIDPVDGKIKWAVFLTTNARMKYHALAVSYSRKNPSYALMWAADATGNTVHSVAQG